MRRVARERREELRPWREVWRTSYARLADAKRDAVGSAVRKVADYLDVDPMAVSIAAHRRYGRGLVEEREARTTERVDKDTSPRSLQATRGHVTRQLRDEIADDAREIDTRRQDRK